MMSLFIISVILFIGAEQIYYTFVTKVVDEEQKGADSIDNDWNEFLFI